MDALVPDTQLIDPDQPIDTNELINGFVPEEHREPARSHVTLIISLLAAILALAMAWRWSPLKEWVDVDTLTALGVELKQAPGAPFLALGTFIIAGLVAFPLTVLIIVCGLVFGPWQGFLYSLLGALLSAMLTFALGHLLGRNTVRRFAGRKLGELNRRLARRGLMSQRGRVRSVFGKWLEALDRWQKLAAHIGDGRRARQLPSLAAYLAHELLPSSCQLA